MLYLLPNLLICRHEMELCVVWVIWESGKVFNLHLVWWSFCRVGDFIFLNAAGWMCLGIRWYLQRLLGTSLMEGIVVGASEQSSSSLYAFPSIFELIMAASWDKAIKNKVSFIQCLDHPPPPPLVVRLIDAQFDCFEFIPIWSEKDMI